SWGSALSLLFPTPLVAADGNPVSFECSRGAAMAAFGPPRSDPDEEFGARLSEGGFRQGKLSWNCCSLDVEAREVVIFGRISNDRLEVLRMCHPADERMAPDDVCPDEGPGIVDLSR